jgi:phosphoenolpyruvate carboxylase
MEAKIVAGIMNILPNDLKRNIEYTKTVYAITRPPQMITGREIVWRIYDYNKISSQAHVVREFQDFINLSFGEIISPSLLRYGISVC